MIINVVKIKPDDVKENDPGAALDWGIRKVLIRRWKLSRLLSDKSQLVMNTFRGQVIHEKETTHQ